MHNDDFSQENIRRTAFFTGHRVLPSRDVPLVRSGLCRCLQAAYEAGYRRFFCGCALGFDTLAALETIRLRETCPDVILSLAIPCADQSDRWNTKDKEVYSRLLDEADDRKVLFPAYRQGVMQTRNRYMADRSSLCICYLTHMRGGTASTVRYAVHNRIPVINLAMPGAASDYSILRENTWNFTFTFRSAGKNAVIAPLSLMRTRKLNMKTISGLSSMKPDSGTRKPTNP